MFLGEGRSPQGRQATTSSMHVGRPAFKEQMSILGASVVLFPPSSHHTSRAYDKVPLLPPDDPLHPKLHPRAPSAYKSTKYDPCMVLSLPELECAMGHALGAYGDLDCYVDGSPAQTKYDAIEKYTGVPEPDVLYATWRSETFEPAFYVAVDKLAMKIVICI
eukprot:gene17681-24032_t